jgi:hypothetical protein
MEKKAKVPLVNKAAAQARRRLPSVQVFNLASLAKLCSQLFDAYHDQHPSEIAQAQLDARRVAAILFCG